MPLAHIDVLVTVAPAEAPYWLVARSKRVLPLADGTMPAETLA